MAIVQIVAPATARTTSASFVVTGPFVLYGEDFEIDEYAVLEQEVTADVWLPLTTKDGLAGVSKYPNAMYWDGIGTFRVVKSVTNAEASVSYEVQ
jgi:hypothetical protein